MLRSYNPKLGFLMNFNSCDFKNTENTFSQFTCPEKEVLFTAFFFLLTRTEIKAFSQLKSLISA